MGQEELFASMEQELRRRGHEIVDFSDAADAYVVNSCSVTAVSDQKSRQMLHRAKARNPKAAVVAAGCYVQAAAETLKADGAVDLVIGNNKKAELVPLLENFFAGKEEGESVIDISGTQEYEPLHIARQTEHTRAFIKVQDGCNQFCSYCIIPYTRGRVRSRRPEDVEAEVRRLASEGYREAVLTGIHLSSYGMDFQDGTDLLSLIRRIHGIDGIERIRFGSLEPRIITEEFASALAGMEKICPHFHLSLQSGCDATLRRMNRRYDTTRFTESALLLHRFFPDCALTTDLIVGFPGETEEEFSTTLGFIRRCGFAQIHVFPYSVRPGTKAADMEQVPKNIKEERAARAGEVAAALHEEYLQSCVGKTLPVLFEQPGAPGFYTGHAPNYMEVSAPGENLHNCLRPVRITAVEGGILKGEIEP